MHERNRRQLCRLVFLASCVLPTLATGSWAAYRLSPLHAAAERAVWQRTLFERTGLTATVQHVSHPAGGSTLLVGVDLVDPDGGAAVARLRQIEIAKTPKGTVILLSQPEIAAGKFLRLWDTLHDRVLRGPLPETPVQITAGELTMEVGQRAQTFTRVRCTLEPQPTGIRTLIDFQLAGIDMPAPAQLQIDRNRQTVPPSTRWSLQTQTPIPCSLFTDYLPGLASFGRDCSFQGVVSASLVRRSWSAELAGRFSRVDLQEAMHRFPHRLTGLAEVTVRKAVLENGRLVEAQGDVATPGGMVSSSVLLAFSEHLHMTLPAGGAGLSQPYLSYQQLGFDFSLSPAGVRAFGTCPGQLPGTVLSLPGGGLVLDPGKTYPVASVIRALSPHSEWLVPATEEAKDLVGLLALPQTSSVRSSVSTLPRVRLRQE